MEFTKGSQVLAAFRGGKGLFPTQIIDIEQIPKGPKIYTVKYADNTVEHGVLPSQLFDTLRAAQKVDPKYHVLKTEPSACCICRVADGRDVFDCQYCSQVVHEECYAIRNDPEDDSDWICQRCCSNPDITTKDILEYACALCPNKGPRNGPFAKLSDKLDAALPPEVPRWVHWMCALWLGVPLQVPEGGSPCGGGVVTSLAGLHDNFSWLCGACGVNSGACIRCPVREQPMSAELPRRFVPVDIGRNVSAVVEKVERARRRSKRDQTWEIPAKDVLAYDDAIDDVASRCEEVLSGRDCGATFHVTCGFEKGFHKSPLGAGPLLDQPYMLCRPHSQALSIPIYSCAHVSVPPAVRSYVLERSTVEHPSKPSLRPSDARAASWYTALEGSERIDGGAEPTGGTASSAGAVCSTESAPEPPTQLPPASALATPVPVLEILQIPRKRKAGAPGSASADDHMVSSAGAVCTAESAPEPPTQLPPASALATPVPVLETLQIPRKRKAGASSASADDHVVSSRDSGTGSPRCTTASAGNAFVRGHESVASPGIPALSPHAASVSSDDGGVGSPGSSAPRKRIRAARVLVDADAGIASTADAAPVVPPTPAAPVVPLAPAAPMSASRASSDPPDAQAAVLPAIRGAETKAAIPPPVAQAAVPAPPPRAEVEEEAPPPPPDPQEIMPALLDAEVEEAIQLALPAGLSLDADVLVLMPLLVAAVLDVQDTWECGQSVLPASPASAAAGAGSPEARVSKHHVCAAVQLVAQAIGLSLASTETRAMLRMGGLSAAAVVHAAARVIEATQSSAA